MKLGLQDLFTFFVYLFMCIPLPQILHAILGTWAWPEYWNGVPEPQALFGLDFMKVNAITSEHRWYLFMVLQARIFLQVGEWTRMPG